MKQYEIEVITHESNKKDDRSGECYTVKSWSATVNKATKLSLRPDVYEVFVEVYEGTDADNLDRVNSFYYKCGKQTMEMHG